MRVSVEPTDRGYNDAARMCDVTLDGQPLKECITADEEAGIAICYVVENGSLQFDGAGNARLKELRGVVKITYPDHLKEFFK